MNKREREMKRGSCCSGGNDNSSLDGRALVASLLWAQQLFIICAMCQGIRFEGCRTGYINLFFISNLHSQNSCRRLNDLQFTLCRLLHANNSHDTGRKFKQQKKSSKFVACYDKAAKSTWAVPHAPLDCASFSDRCSWQRLWPTQ